MLTRECFDWCPHGTGNVRGCGVCGGRRGEIAEAFAVAYEDAAKRVRSFVADAERDSGLEPATRAAVAALLDILAINLGTTARTARALRQLPDPTAQLERRLRTLAVLAERALDAVAQDEGHTDHRFIALARAANRTLQEFPD